MSNQKESKFKQEIKKAYQQGYSAGWNAGYSKHNALQRAAGSIGYGKGLKARYKHDTIDSRAKQNGVRVVHNHY